MNAIFCSSNESNQTDWRRTALVVQLIERNRWKWWVRLMWEGNGEEKEQENARKRWKCASVLNRKRRRRGRRFVFPSSSLLLSYLITYLAIQVCVWSLVIWIIIIKDDMQVQFWNWSWSWCCRRTRRCIKRSRSFNVLDTPHHGILLHLHQKLKNQFARDALLFSIFISLQKIWRGQPVTTDSAGRQSVSQWRLFRCTFHFFV